MKCIKCSLFEGRTLLNVGEHIESGLWMKYNQGFTSLAVVQMDGLIRELFVISEMGGIVRRHEENKM